MKILALGDENTVMAFRLAGIPGRIVGSRQEAATIIKETEGLAIAIIVKEYSPGEGSGELPIIITIPKRERM